MALIKKDAVFEGSLLNFETANEIFQIFTRKEDRTIGGDDQSLAKLCFILFYLYFPGFCY